MPMATSPPERTQGGPACRNGDPMPSLLQTLLEANTMPAAAELLRTLPDGRIQCLACAHRCRIADGRAGVCHVRFNRGGQLMAPAGYVAGLAADPIEKKPFYHVLPGSEAMSFGMLGCDLHCPYCQNWISSQTLRDEGAVAEPSPVTAGQIVAAAKRRGTPVVISTYNEPLITAEWAVEIFRPARAEGMLCGFVSNGHATPEVLEYLRPYVDLYKVDLKSFQDRNYRRLGGSLAAVLDTIRRLKDLDFWVEVVTLVVPGFNDSDGELRDIASFLAGVSPDIPWHVTAFHPDYRMTDPPRTPVETLIRARDIGLAAGLRYAYAGNVAGGVGHREHTFCHACGRLLIRRHGFRVVENHLADGRCPGCDAAIPGVWRRPERS